MDKLKMVLMVCSTLLMINCSFKPISVKPINVDNFWLQFLHVLKNGDIDVNELFTVESVLDRVKAVVPTIPNQIESFKKLISQDFVPNIDIGIHCSTPYGCDFMGHCWKHIPEYSIFNISNLYTTKKFELYENGLISFDQLDLNNSKLNSNQHASHR